MKLKCIVSGRNSAAKQTRFRLTSSAAAAEKRLPSVGVTMSRAPLVLWLAALAAAIAVLALPARRYASWVQWQAREAGSRSSSEAAARARGRS